MIRNITPKFLSAIKLPYDEARKLNYLLVRPQTILPGSITLAIGINGISRVSSALKASGRHVFTLNLDYKEEPMKLLREAIAEHNIDIVGVGAFSVHYAAVKDVLDAVKQLGNITTIVGGSIISADPETAMTALENADFGVIGEGEITINELAYALESGSSPDEVRGIIYRGSNGLVKTGQQSPITDLDMLPFPDYHGFELGALLDRAYAITYRARVGLRVATIDTSRSCLYKCTFCFHSTGDQYRRRSLDNIFTEIDWLVSEFKIDGLWPSDELFNGDKDWVTKFCGRIKPYHLKWRASLRVDLVTKTMLTMMKESGCQIALFGVESADDKILKSMRKNITVKQIDHVFDICEEIGLHAYGNLIFGDLEETLETITNSLKWWKAHPQYPLNLAWIITFPGTHLYKLACERGIIADKVQYLRDGCPVVNISKLTNDEYMQMQHEVNALQEQVYRRKTNHDKLTSGVSLYKNIGSRLTMTLECPHCNQTTTDHFEVCLPYKTIFNCIGCGAALFVNMLDHIDLALVRRNLATVLSGHRVAVWAATPANIPPLFEIAPELQEAANVLLINSSTAMRGTELGGKTVYAPGVIEAKNIDTVIIPNYKKVFDQICVSIKTEHPQVLSIYHLAELIAC